ncbi:MAG: siphovirus ReqiPepy6 Gp37-like family protein [Oscillospiraceae bacterium]|nr:siphovirus ReqiPepy6 Gp37-like family protein [Oscillospiraceae bacterium]
MEIRIFDWENGEFITRFITYKASNQKYKVHAFEPSGFSFDFPLGEYGAWEFKRGRFVLIEDFIGVIEDIRRNTDANNDMMSISGKDIKGLLAQRIIIPITFSGIQGTAGYDIATGWTDACIKHFWRNNISVNAELNRRFPFIIIGADKNIGTSDDKYMARFEKLSDVTAELANNANVVITSKLVGATPQIEAGTILLDVVLPTMRTYNSDQPLILSLDRQTALQLEHIQEAGGYRNAFYATQSGAQFADETLTMLYVRDGETESANLDRREEHINVSVNTPVAGQEYNEMRRQAVHDMLNYEETNTLSAHANFTHLKYKRDYDVGDFVTVQNKDWGIETDIQITAVEISDDASGRTETMTLGTGEKSYIKQILTEVKNI